MAVSINEYDQYAATTLTTWSPVFGTPGDWLVVIHAMTAGDITKMGGDPGAYYGGWPTGSWQLLAQVDAGLGLPKIRVWAVRFTDTVSTRQIAIVNDQSDPAAESHQHLYFLTGTRAGSDAADVFSVGAAASGTAATGQTVPAYAVDSSGLLIGSWVSASVLNYTSLGSLTPETEVDGIKGTSRSGERTISAAGPSTIPATASTAAAWAAVSIAVRPTSTGSVTFPTAPLRMKTEIAPGANPGADPATWAALWTDITDDAQPRDGGVTITRGRQDETSTVSPSSMTLTLNNTSGKYVRLNPTSPYYGRLTKNTPARLWVDAGDGWRLRYTGHVSEWPPRSLGGTVDEHMPIRVDGPTRRLSRGRVLDSVIRRTIVTRGDAAGYWPLETDAASAIPGGANMLTRGTVTFGNTTLPGSAGAATAPYGSSTYASIRGMKSTGSWQISFWLECPSGATDLTPVASWVTPNSTYGRWFAYANSPAFANPGIVVVEVSQHTTITEQFVTGSTDIRGLGPVLVTIFARNDSGNVIVDIFINGVLDGSSVIVGDVVAPMSGAGINNLTFASAHDIEGTISHMYAAAGVPGVLDPVVDWLVNAGAGHVGERACDRIRRIGGEQGIPVVIVGDDGTSAPMGPQPVADFLDILRECEAADGGVLYERRDGRLAYQARVGRYNTTPALTLDYSAGHVAPPLEPEDDDQHTLNDYTVSRENGGSARVFDQGHIDTVGQYADSGTLNVAADSQLADRAGWRVHLGTADDLRYPSLIPNLNGRPGLIPAWAALDVGQAVALTNPGRDLPPGQIDAFAEGYTETIDVVSWTATINASPGKPWKVIALDDAILGRLDTAGSALNASVTATATTISVKTTSGPLWTTASADFPFDVLVGGEQVTVTGVTGTSSPQTFTVTRSVNGVVKAHSAGDDVRLATTPILT